MKNELLALMTDRPDDVDWSILDSTHPAVLWTKDYYNTYGSLPSLDLFVEECLPDGEKPIALAPWSYYVRQGLDLRFVQEASKYLENFNTSYADDPKKAILALRAKFESLSEPANGLAPADIFLQLDERWQRFARRKGKGIFTGIDPFDEVSGGLDPDDEFLILSARLGMGKALKYGTNVLGADGNFRPVEDFKVGEYLVGLNGKPTKILKVRDFKDLNLYRVTFGDGNFIDCCEDHLWTLRDRDKNNRMTTLTTKELFNSSLKTIGKNTGKTYNLGYNYNRWFLPQFTPAEFSKKSYIIPPYTLGVLLGDGSLTTNRVTFCSLDEAIAEAVSKELPDHLQIRKIPSSIADYSIVWNNHKNIKNDYVSEIDRLNLKKKSTDKHIPEEYLHGSVSQRLELLAGILDTDGYLPGKGQIIISLSCERLIDDITYLVESLGGYATKKARPTHYIDSVGNKHIAKTSYELSIRLCQDIPLRRTHMNRWEKPKFQKVRPIVDIQPIPRSGGRCFIVEAEDHLFITDHFIPTHNSFIAHFIALNMAMQGLNVGIYSGEMNEFQVGARIDTWLTHVSNWGLTRGKMQGGLEEQREAYRTKVKGKILVLTAQHLGKAASPTDIRKFVRENNLTAIVMDQLSLMVPDGRQYQDMHMQFGALSTQLRILQQQLKIPMIAVSQLNRAAEGQDANAGNLSGADKIGQDATAVLILERTMDKQEITVKCVKAREYSVPPKGWSFIWDVDKGVLSYIKTAIDGIKAKSKAAKKADSDSAVEAQQLATDVDQSAMDQPDEDFG